MTRKANVDNLSTMRKALAAVTPTLRDVAEWCGVSYATVRAYSTGDRKPTSETELQFAAALRRQAKRLETLAAQLERRSHGKD